jgi:hypothetical protein
MKISHGMKLSIHEIFTTVPEDNQKAFFELFHLVVDEFLVARYQSQSIPSTRNYSERDMKLAPNWKSYK